MDGTMTGTTLIVGGDSTIGKALQSYCVEVGLPFLATTRRHGPKGAHQVFLDLAADHSSWQLPDGVTIAILCGGVTRLEECATDPQRSFLINVEATATLARLLHRRGALVIHLSTNQVFDGAKPFRTTTDPISPPTEYGRQKAEVERRVLALGPGTAVVRLTKVLGDSFPLLAEWQAALAQQRVVEPFSDLVMSPVPLTCVLSVLRLIGERRLSGVFQVSGERDISYADVAYLVAEHLGVDSGLIRPVSGRSAACPYQHFPRHTTLCVSELASRLGMRPPLVEHTIHQALFRWKTCD
jgi:dTDP-4-dehydrorhamnose reductase